MVTDWKQLLLVVLIVLAIGNGADSHKRRTRHKSQSFKVTTFNTALFDFRFTPAFELQGSREQRRVKLIDALNHVDSDFVCLQEVWIAEDVAAIVHGVRKKYKYSFSDAHNGKSVESFIRPGEEPLCDSEVFGAFIDCVMSDCLVLGLTGLWDCVLDCFEQISLELEDPITTDCFICAITAFPNEDIILEECAGSTEDLPYRKMNTKGLLILSKKKLSQTRSVDFFPSTTEIIPRGYLAAKVKGIEAVCTHLSGSDLIPSTQYPEFDLEETFGFTSYADQNAFEIQQLITTFSNLRRTILLGGFNSGTANAASTPAVQAFMMEGLTALNAVFDTMTVDECTLCSTEENAFSLTDENYIIDHVFVNGVCISRVKRVFTNRDYSILVDQEVLPISDHYGVSAEIVPSRACRR